MKHFLVFLLMITALLFTGCARNDQKTTIEFTTWGSASELAIIIEAIKDFETNNPDIKVHLQHIPQNYFQKLHLLFASNLTPDVMMLNNFYLPLYANANLLEEFTLTNKEKEEYFKKSLNAFTFNDKLYAVPRDVSNLVIYYNKDIFKKYNIKYPQNGWTQEQFLKTVQKLQTAAKRDNKERFFAISADYEPILFILPYLMSNNGGLLDDKKNLILTKDESLEGLQVFSDLINKYKVAPKKIDSSSQTSTQMFLNQNLAMQLTGRWVVPKYREEASFDWDVVTFPQGNLGSVVPIDGSAFAIAKASKHKPQAKKLVNYLTSQEVSEKFADSGLVVPAEKATANSVAFINPNLKPHNAQAFILATETGVATPVIKNYTLLTDLLIKELEAVFQEDKQAKTIFTNTLLQKLKSTLN